MFSWQTSVLSVCRYVSDLAVGSIALQDPAGPHATHMTFSANQQLSGWSPPAAAGEEEAKSTLAAAGPGPRMFVVFEDGSGYEVLDTDIFTAYAQRKVSSRDKLCTTECELACKPLSNIFCTHVSHVPKQAGD